MDRIDIDKPTLDEPRLYLLVRKDLYDLNPGKLGAQTGHAGSKFAGQVLRGKDKALIEQYDAWDAGRGFGTKITLSATKNDILDVVKTAQERGLVADVVVDPTYPFRNYFGEVFVAEELTCAYIFAPTDVSQEMLDDLRKFPLHP